MLWDKSIGPTAKGILAQILSYDNPSLEATHFMRMSSLPTKDGRLIKQALIQLEVQGYLRITPIPNGPVEWDWYSEACDSEERTNWLDRSDRVC